MTAGTRTSPSPAWSNGSRTTPSRLDIDRLALRYQGNRFRNREAARVSAWMRCERWYRWD